MKIPKSRKRFCPKCKKHTTQTVSQAKSAGRNKTHPMSFGSRTRMKRRGLDRGFGNKGKTSRGAISSFKRTGAKTSKKVDLRFKCKECGKIAVQAQGFRAKKTEFK
ncbi:MAG: 50S ribosomal protein L44e [Nanoarchaeota archaeon]|nr:50S ribosomal protein L44e [Nanoarchaeota archaeon]